MNSPISRNVEALSQRVIADTLDDLKQMWSAMADLCKSIPGAWAVISSRSDLPPIIADIFEQAKAYEQERDIRADREAVLQAIAESLDIAPEPHQTYWERLMQAAQDALPPNLAALSESGSSLDADMIVTEAMHILGAQEGETLLQLAYRVKERLEWLNRQLAQFTNAA